MQTPFRELIRSQKLKGPTDRNFDLKKWEKAWLSVENDNERHIYNAGIKKDYTQALGGAQHRR